MKKERQEAILSLIEKYEISTQEELSEKLQECGFNVTQVTVSRDIKELKLLKVHSDKKGTKYGYPSETKNNSSDINMNKLKSIVTHAVTSADYANNIVIIKTLQGMAQGVAYALENLNTTSILGSIAGDDTIMVVVRNESTAKELTGEISEFIK